VQKYERGANRIGASRLFELSKVLDVQVSFFFEDMAAPERPRSRAREAPPQEERDPMTKRETLELVRAYNRIGDPTVRRRVFEMVKAVAKTLQG
jgi:transcriptional regulator with XRE-family HTH domain